MNDTQMPHLTRELIEYLESVYPDQAPRLEMPERMIWMKVGQVELVRMLRLAFDHQQEVARLGDGDFG